jgi:hypothetical protein
MFKVGCALYYSMGKLLINTILPELHLVVLLYYRLVMHGNSNIKLNLRFIDG